MSCRAISCPCEVSAGCVLHPVQPVDRSATCSFLALLSPVQGIHRRGTTLKHVGKAVVKPGCTSASHSSLVMPQAQVAHRMSKPLQELALRPESAVDIRRTCKEDLDHYPDATLHLQLQLQLAIANDDFERAALCAPPSPPSPHARTHNLAVPGDAMTLRWACPSPSKSCYDALSAARRLRSEIDNLLSHDRVLCLVVAIETALADERYEVREQGLSKHCLRAEASAVGCHTSFDRAAPAEQHNARSESCARLLVVLQASQHALPPVN